MTVEDDRARALARARARARAAEGDDDSDFSLRRAVGTAAEGVSEGLANTLGFPVDLVNQAPRLVNLLPGEQGVGPISDRPVGGSEMLRDALASVGLTGNFEPQNQAERIAGRIGEEVGMAALPSALMLGAGARAAQRAGPLADSMLASIGRSPGRATAGEAASAVGAGTGAGIAQEVAPGNVQAELVGQLLGGISPGAIATVSPTGVGARMGARLASNFSDQAQTRAGRQAVERFLGGKAEDLRPGIAEAERLQQRIPDFQPSLPEATGQSSILAAQRDLESRASGQVLDDLVRRRTQNERAISRFVENRAPRGDTTPSFVVDTATQRIEGVRQDIARQAGPTLQAREDLAASLPRADRAEAGATIRDRLAQARAQRRQEANRLATELGINDLDVSVDFRQSAEELLSEFQPQRFDDPEAIPGVLSEVRETLQSNGAVTLADIKRLRERVSDDLIDAVSGSTPNQARIRNLTLLKERVDDVFRELAETSDPDLAARLQRFRQYYFNDVIRPFEQGAAFQVRRKGGTGFFQTLDERVASSFFAPGKPTAAHQFTEILGNDPDAVAAMENAVLDDLRAFAVSDGVIDPNKMSRWVERHRDVLAELPERIRQEVSNVFDAENALQGRLAELGQREQRLGQVRLTRLLDQFRRENTTPESVINQALNDPRLMRQLVQSIGDDELALNSLQRVIWDRVAPRSGADMVQFIQSNRNVLDEVLSDDHIQDLMDIAGARAMLENAPPPRGSADLPRVGEEIERRIGQGIPQLASRLFAFRSGRMQKGYLVTDTVLRGLRGRAQVSADEALRGALFDPTVAREMAEAIDTGNISLRQAKRLQSRLINLGVVAVDDNEEEAAVPQ